jgi:hypothetical protein
VILRFAGWVSIRDILNATIEYEQDDRFDDLLHVIADYTQIEGCRADAIDIDDVWAVDMGAMASNKRIRKAIVTTTPEVIALVGRYCDAPDQAFPTRVFSTVADARAWLNA